MTTDFSKEWITKNSISILQTYSSGITVRQLYYRLVALGMINDIKHYKKVVNAMTGARWEGIVDFEAFIDRERSMYGTTAAEPTDLQEKIEEAQEQIKAWMNHYTLNQWENQPNYIEVWIEKKALQGVFERPCRDYHIALAPCKGYPSLTFLYEASKRFEEAIERGQTPIILYFGDYDPSGEDIPRSVQENLSKMGCDIEVTRIALNPDQIRELGLPSAPAKETDTRARTWSGAGVVELDAVEPTILSRIVTTTLTHHFDESLSTALETREATEREEYRRTLTEYVNSL